MINLYFIDGISVNDEPTFDTLALQATFFDSHLVQLVDTGFYPPHYINKIKLSVEDFNLKKQVNYLSLDYNNKIYYYFIDSINYINEDIYELNVVMDTIQTYMFNIHCENALMERMSISRWNSQGKINRNYIRENIGDDTFELIRDSKQEVSLDETIHVVVYGQPKGTSGNKPWWEGNNTIKTSIYSNDIFVDNNMLVALFISNDDYSSIARKYFVSHPSAIKENFKVIKLNDKDINVSDLIKNDYAIASDVAITAIYKIPMKDLDIKYKLTFDDNKNPLNVEIILPTLTKITPYSGGTDLLVPTSRYVLGINNFNMNVNSIEDLIGFKKHSTIRTNFSLDYCPQMLDTNYIRITYGDMLYQVSYPLEYLTDIHFYKYAVLDITNGNYYYSISSDSTYDKIYGNDDYDTNVMSRIDLSTSLISDKYVEYDQANKARLLGFINGNISDTINGLPRTTGNTTTTYQSTIKKRVNKRLRKVKTIDNVSSTISAVSGNPLGIASSMLGNAIDFAENEINNDLAPNTLRNSTDIIQTYGYGLLRRHTKVFYKRNIISYAKYFESVGYKVNEWYDNLKIFNNDSPISIRYYFNVIKMQDMNIDLHGCPSDNETIDNILQRFYDGIRLWRVDNEANLYGKMGQPTLYDNVERSFVE